MYVIIKTGGKQYRVAEGDVIDVELLSSDRSNSHVGSPLLENFPVYGEVVGTVSGEKITSLKYKRSHNQCRKWGHRQKYTRVKITGIGSNKGSNKKD